MRYAVLSFFFSMVFCSCSDKLTELSEKDKEKFLLENLQSYESSDPDFLSIRLANKSTGETFESCILANLLFIFLTTLDSSIIDGNWEESSIKKLIPNRTLILDDSFFTRVTSAKDTLPNIRFYIYRKVDPLRFRSMELLLKDEGILEILSDYKTFIKNIDKINNSKATQTRKEFDDKLQNYIDNFGFHFCHYLFIHGIRTSISCEEGGIYLSGIFEQER